MINKSKIITRTSMILIAVIMLGIYFWGHMKGNNSQKAGETKAVAAKDKAKELNQNNNDVKTKLTIHTIREFNEGALRYNDRGIPVLYYHSIGYEKGNELRVPKEKFKEQMKFLKDNGYTALTLDEAYMFFTENKPVPEKSVVITLDDGYEDNYTEAYPILKEFGIKATIFIVTAWTDDKNLPYLTSEQIKELDTNGIEIQSHTANHDQLDKLDYSKQLETLKSSKEYLEKLLNKKVNYIAYPFGHWNKDSIKALKDTGYTMAFTTASGWADKTNEIYTLHRVYISGTDNMEQFKAKIKNSNYNKKQ